MAKVDCPATNRFDLVQSPLVKPNIKLDLVEKILQGLFYAKSLVNTEFVGKIGDFQIFL